MSEVLIYTKSWCGFCLRAKSLLAIHDVAYDEIDVETDPRLEREMIEKAGGRRTVPQVFIRGEHIGGSEELAQFASAGGLDKLATAG